MKKIICLVLALMMCLSLALPAAAATKSREDKPHYNSTNPKTGDVISLWVGTMGVSAAGLAAITAARKKEQ